MSAHARPRARALLHRGMVCDLGSQPDLWLRRLESRNDESAASSPGKTVVRFSQSIPPGCGLQSRPTMSPSSEKVMVRVKAAALHPVRRMTQLLRAQKPMPRNAPWPHSESHSGWRSMGAPSHRRSGKTECCPLRLQTGVRFGFHPDDTTPIPSPSRYYGRRQDAPLTDRLRNKPATERRWLRHLCPARPTCLQGGSTRANLPLPNRSACVTKPT